MTEVNGDAPPVEAGPVPSERGRYAVYETPDGGLLIARRVNLCNRCLDCECGEQADPIGPISGAIVGMARAAAAGKLNMSQVMKKMAGRGR